MNNNSLAQLRTYRLGIYLDSLYPLGPLDFVEEPEEVEKAPAPKKPKLIPGHIELFQLPAAPEVSDLRAAA